MNIPRFWLIRHALVEPAARAMLYGTLDVTLCPAQLQAEAGSFRALAARLPRPARWVATPLSRTRDTAKAIFAAGYPEQSLDVEPALIEQDLGDWQGLAHAQLPERLRLPAHAFWPLAGHEDPPGGESLAQVIRRAGAAMEQLAGQAARDGTQDIVIVSHGGTIRAIVAHAIGVGPDPVLHLSVQNLSLTRLERHVEGWRVVSVNEPPLLPPG